jgi:hypothetical protein
MKAAERRKSTVPCNRTAYVLRKGLLPWYRAVYAFG